MAKLYMLDTDMASYVIRGTCPGVMEKFSEHFPHLCLVLDL